jgi:hypothetical protein
MSRPLRIEFAVNQEGTPHSGFDLAAGSEIAKVEYL